MMEGIEQIQEFLATPRVAYLSTVDLQGYPHTVPTWFAVEGGDLVFSATRTRARVKHILASPKGAVAIGGNRGEREGYLIQGTFTMEEDPDRRLRDRILQRYVSRDAQDELKIRLGKEDRIVVRLTPKKVIRVR